MIESRKQERLNNTLGLRNENDMRIKYACSVVLSMYLISVQSDKAQQLVSILQRYHEAQRKHRLLLVSFTTLGEYLHLLRETCCALQPLGSRAMLYLAAAVSDFYIPADMMVCA